MDKLNLWDQPELLNLLAGLIISTSKDAYSKTDIDSMERILKWEKKGEERLATIKSKVEGSDQNTTTFIQHEVETYLMDKLNLWDQPELLEVLSTLISRKDASKYGYSKTDIDGMERILKAADLGLPSDIDFASKGLDPNNLFKVEGLSDEELNESLSGRSAVNQVELPKVLLSDLGEEGREGPPHKRQRLK